MSEADSMEAKIDSGRLIGRILIDFVGAFCAGPGTSVPFVLWLIRH